MKERVHYEVNLMEWGIMLRDYAKIINSYSVGIELPKDDNDKRYIEIWNGFIKHCVDNHDKFADLFEKIIYTYPNSKHLEEYKRLASLFRNEIQKYDSDKQENIIEMFQNTCERSWKLVQEVCGV